MSIGSMSHADYKKWPRHPVELKGQGPSSEQRYVSVYLYIKLELIL